jgi:hypothetical protein
MKLNLKNITLLGIDCVDPVRLQRAMDVCEAGISFGEVKLLSSRHIDDPRLVDIPDISSYEQLSDFCLRDLSKYVDTEFVLMVQWDGFILNPMSWTDEFLKYDYIGSPWVVKDWSIDDFGFPEALRGSLVVGNGGFCLRSKKMLETSSRLFDRGLIKHPHPEDIAISVWDRKLFEDEGILFAPPELAKKFALEGGDFPLESQFGFHGFYTDLSAWFSAHKEYSVIFDLYAEYRIKPRKQWKPDFL